MKKETVDEIVGRALRGEPYVPRGGGDDAPAQPAAHGQAPAGESLRTEALCDLSYSHGLKAGWNYCASDDLAGFERAQKIGTEALRTLKSTPAQAAPAVGAVAGPGTDEVLAAARNWGDVEPYLCRSGSGEQKHRIVFHVHERAAHFAKELLAAAPTPAAQADSQPAPVLVAALIAAKQAINSMKVEAETAAQGDEQMMLEACETISNEGLQADIAIRTALESAQSPAPSVAAVDYPHARRFGGCPSCGRSDCVAMSCTRADQADLLQIAARKEGGA